MEDAIDYCSVCHKPILPGQLTTGQTWSGDGGDHIECHQSHEDDTERSRR